ncbi:hypothetical protein FSP39_021026 [Pinctada imbricata]|uniref:Solute carrier family 23 member 2 n=1 Tax=Pinctada imbricata TaxID=66713 RepID=A0AA88Y0A9_PINIB|nr:hypothetical protein FSP39_021026 [Pinctada imbricata]
MSMNKESSRERVDLLRFTNGDKKCAGNGVACHDSVSDDLEVIIERSDSDLLYKVAEHPPIHLTLFFGFQQALVAISSSLAISLMVAEVTCAMDDEALKARLLSSTLFMNGVTTIIMNLVGIGLPLYQGAASDFLVPLFAMQVIDSGKCSGKPASPTQASFMENVTLSGLNGTAYNVVDDHTEFVLSNIRQLQGSLIAAGIFQGMLGATGLLGVLMRFVGPNTIVPTLLLTGLYMVKAVMKFVQVQWGVASCVCSIAVILSLYLGKRRFPIPFWNRQNGFHILWYPLHQVFSILIAMMVGWLLCGILTMTGVLSDDPKSVEFNARTDARSDYIAESAWIQFPYPGQFGPFDFNVSVFLGFAIASITSIMDSLGDYYACAQICSAPPPPRHAINRGIALEGFCSAISGMFGCGHGTTTYGGNLGVLGLTRVGSRDVMIVAGVIYLIFGITGKVCAVFISIPYPVLGGALIVMFGMFIGIAISSLHVVNLNSTRNMAVLGISILVGLLLPTWLETNKDTISFGGGSADSIIKMLLANPSLVGGVIACFLDNTIPGTLEERGITAWQNKVYKPPVDDSGAEIESVYENLLPGIIKRNRILSKLPFFPDLKDKDNQNVSMDA